MFFSVKSATKIAGKSYKPCICYPLTKFLEVTVKRLEKSGKAVIYSERVFFQNGKLLVKTSAETAPVVEKKPAKKEKKVEIKEEETLDETINEDSIVLEESADESEGF